MLNYGENGSSFVYIYSYQIWEDILYWITQEIHHGTGVGNIWPVG